MLERFDARWEMNKAHQRELLEVAKKQRLLAQSRKKIVRQRGRMFVVIGDFLIASGVRLKAHYEPVAN